MDPVQEFEAQPDNIPPGTEGWWRVWGAKPHAIRKGDILMHNTEVGTELTYIEDTFTAQAAPMRVGFIHDGGERSTIGALCPIMLLRRGTHNTLA